MSRKGFFWYEFSILVGGSVIIFLGEQPYGLILGAALMGLGCLMFCLSLIRLRKSPELRDREGSPTIRE